MPEYGWTPRSDQLRAGRLPRPRGPVSAWLSETLARPERPAVAAPTPGDDPVHGEDSALALYVLYELHYRGFAGVAEEWEWDPSLLSLRAVLEQRFADTLRCRVGPLDVGKCDDSESLLRAAMAMAPDGPSLSGYAADRATLEQTRELAVHRSLYQLKEADPHSFGLPRLTGAAKAALVEIQADEYGQGEQADSHSVLFGLTMTELGLDASYGAYLDAVPAVTLATVNLVSMFGLHRRWRGALCGHLATFEMCSVGPMGGYLAGLRRLGMSTAAQHFYAVHVVADAHHSSVAAEKLVGGLLAHEPHLRSQVAFGAAALSLLEHDFAVHVLGCFERGSTSLRTPREAPPAPHPATCQRPSAHRRAADVVSPDDLWARTG